MKFDKDVFISYAHLDDEPLAENEKGWVTDFHKMLHTRLEQTVGEGINVWRDIERLTGNTEFTPEIKAQIPLLRVMVSIITPRYVKSDWCKDELGLFYLEASKNGGVKIGNKWRIFKIVKTPVDNELIEEKLPGNMRPIFTDILDYKFYRPESDTGHFKELSAKSWEDNAIRREYMDKLDDVAQDIAGLLKKLKNNNAPEAPQKKIYLAQTTYDLQGYRDNLVRELKEAGFTVLPDKNLSTVAEAFTDEVKAALTDSLLSVHLVSPNTYAVQPEGADKSTVMLQNELAAAKSEAGNFPRLIWIPPGTNTSNTSRTAEKQKAFVDALRKEPGLQCGADILEGPLEELKLAIFDTVKRLEREEKERREAEERAKAKGATGTMATVAASAKNTAPKIVYLICDQPDLDNTRPLEDAIIDSGHEVLLPLFEGDLKDLRDAHAANLKVCDAVIIYYGAGNYRWATSKKSDLLRLSAQDRNKPVLAQSIFIAGPPDKDKETFKAAGFDIINGLSGFNADDFGDFFQKLQ